MSAAGKVNRSRRCDKAFFLITLTIVLIPFSFVNLYSASDNESHNRAQDRVTLRWFDAGLDLSDGTGSADWRLKPEFRPFRRNLDKFMGTIPSDGQIFIPTPSAEKAPRTDAEWKTLREHIFHGTHLRIKQGLARGIKDFVIGTAMMPEGKAQSTAISGPRVSLKRSNQFQYAKALLESLSKIKQDLASKSVKVTNQGLIVGKGGSALIRALPEASRGSLDGLITVDSHASLGDILRAGTVLEDKFALIATGQSTPENNIVSSGADNLLKLLRPPVQMFRIATSFDQMVSEMSRENSKAIKLAELILTENSRLRFSETEEMTIRDLLKRILDSLGSESRGNGLIRNPSELPSTLSAIQETVNQIASDPEPPLGPYDWVQIADELSSLRHTTEETLGEKALGGLVELSSGIIRAIIDEILEKILDEMMSDMGKIPDACDVLAKVYQEACKGTDHAMYGATRATVKDLDPENETNEAAYRGAMDASDTNCRALRDLLAMQCKNQGVPFPVASDSEHNDPNDKGPPPNDNNRRPPRNDSTVPSAPEQPQFAISKNQRPPANGPAVISGKNPPKSSVVHDPGGADMSGRPVSIGKIDSGLASEIRHPFREKETATHEVPWLTADARTGKPGKASPRRPEESTSETPKAGKKGLAISLKVVQKQLAECMPTGKCPKELLDLFGVTKIHGYAIDDVRQDILLIGELDKSLPALHLEDFVVAIRNVLKEYVEERDDGRYYSYPLCSIDPVLKDVADLQKAFAGDGRSWRQICRRPQDVLVKGVPFKSRFAKVLVEADYHMKRLADGSDKLHIDGFDSMLGMKKRVAQDEMEQGKVVSVAASSQNRFWFLYGGNNYLQDSGAIWINECQVRLDTEQQYLTSKGKIEATGKVEPYAEKFKEMFTAKYAEIAKARPIYAELEGLYRFFSLAKVIASRDGFSKSGLDIDYLLHRFPVQDWDLPKKLPGIAYEDGVTKTKKTSRGEDTRSIRFRSCGGATLALSVKDADLMPDGTGKLGELSARAVKLRPNDGTPSWNLFLPLELTSVQPRKASSAIRTDPQLDSLGSARDERGPPASPEVTPVGAGSSPPERKDGRPAVVQTSPKKPEYSQDFAALPRRPRPVPQQISTRQESESQPGTPKPIDTPAAAKERLSSSPLPEPVPGTEALPAKDAARARAPLDERRQDAHRAITNLSNSVVLDVYVDDHRKPHVTITDSGGRVQELDETVADRFNQLLALTESMKGKFSGTVLDAWEAFYRDYLSGCAEKKKIVLPNGKGAVLKPLLLIRSSEVSFRYGNLEKVSALAGNFVVFIASKPESRGVASETTAEELSRKINGIGAVARNNIVFAIRPPHVGLTKEMRKEWERIVVRLEELVGPNRVLFNPSKEEFTRFLKDRSREIIVIELTHTEGMIRLKGEDTYSSRDLHQLDLSHIKYLIGGIGTCSLPKLENGEFVAALKRCGVGLLNASYREVSNQTAIRRMNALIRILENPEGFNFPAYYLLDVLDQLIGTSGSDTTNLGKLEPQPGGSPGPDHPVCRWACLSLRASARRRAFPRRPRCGNCRV